MRILPVGLVLLLTVGAVACTRAAPGEPSARSCKPEAPVRLDASARPLAGGVWEIGARLWPTVDVEDASIELVLPDGVVADGPTRVAFGPTATGHGRAFASRVRARSGGEVHVSARVTLPGGLSPNRVATVTVGAPVLAAPAPRVRRVVIAGELVDEVRP